MRKYISPTVAIFMGFFMKLSGLIYFLTMDHIFGLHLMDSGMQWIVLTPTLVLFISGMSSIVWGILMMDKLRFSAEADGWVLK